MNVQPLPHQLVGAQFLAQRKAALLADAPRVGKTGASIRAADFVFAQTALTITTATGRAQWGREWRTWGLPRDVQVIYGTVTPPASEVCVVGWHEFWQEPLHSALLARRWDVLIPDEAHYACNVLNGTNPTQRTIKLYGKRGLGLIHSAGYIWPLTGTPMPNGAPDDLYPMLRGIAPERLGPYHDHDLFLERYCELKFRRYRGVVEKRVTGGRNLEEFAERLDGFYLRRTQADVGIREPIYTLFALDVPKLPTELVDVPYAQDILDAAHTGDTKTLDLHMGPLRRLTGSLKASAVIAAAKEQLEDRRIEKLVLMAWHSDVIDALVQGLKAFGPMAVDGRTSPTLRDTRIRQFQTDPSVRVFIGQIVAAGEAIDLSVADEEWIVEYSFLPKDMSQAALRITNHSRTSQPLVRVCVLPGSFDETLASILVPKVSTIRTVMEKH